VQQKRVLVVDDEEPVRYLMTNVFQSAGYRVECAKNGREALEMMTAPSPDLVTLDLMMPDLTGWEVIEELRGRPDPPTVVLVSGATDGLNQKRPLPFYVGGVVNKPFLPRDLLEICDSVLRERGREAPSNERRRVARRDIVMDVRVAPSVGTPMLRGKLTDLSPLGAEVEVGTSVSVGQTVRLAFRFPGRDRALLIDGKVQYSTPRGPFWACGLEFQNVAPLVQEELGSLLDIPFTIPRRIPKDV
jgi:CheY-like chemotaxis protein